MSDKVRNEVLFFEKSKMLLTWWNPYLIRCIDDACVVAKLQGADDSRGHTEHEAPCDLLPLDKK